MREVLRARKSGTRPLGRCERPSIRGRLSRLLFAASSAILALPGAARASDPLPVEGSVARAGGLDLSSRSAILLAAANATTALSLPTPAFSLAQSAALTALLETRYEPDVEDPRFSARSYSPDSWFVDSVVSSMDSSFMESPHRDFTREAVLVGPRFFARESRFSFTPKADREEQYLDSLDQDRKLFFRTGVEAIRETFEQTDLYYHVARHFDDLDLHLWWSVSSQDADSSRAVPLIEIDPNREPSSSDAFVTRADARLKLSRIVDSPTKIAEIHGWLADVVEFTIYPLGSQARLTVPLYEKRSLSVSLVGELESSLSDSAVFVSFTARF